jgi:hypothetical protein
MDSLGTAQRILVVLAFVTGAVGLVAPAIAWRVNRRARRLLTVGFACGWMAASMRQKRYGHQALRRLNQRRTRRSGVAKLYGAGHSAIGAFRNRPPDIALRPFRITAPSRKNRDRRKSRRVLVRNLT